jgi:hypothetical protein
VPSVKADDTRVETFRIEIIVKDELDNSDSALTTMSEQERTAFATMVPTALPQANPKPAP